MKFIAFVFSILMFTSISNAGSGADCEQVTADVSISDSTNPTVLDSSGDKKTKSDGTDN